MKGFIITGHGNFATGLLSAAEVIMGSQKDVLAVDFLGTDSSEALKEKLIKAIESMESDEIIVLSDLKGGSPFRCAVEIATSRQGMKVVAGTNLPMLCENLFTRDGLSLDLLATSCLEAGKNGVDLYEMTVRQQVEEEDGI